jgi:sensor c-di-GMP phosphodiesterase-like protein
LKFKLLAKAALLLFGVLLGIALGESIAHAVKLGLGKDELVTYADRLMDMRVRITREIDQMADAVNHDGFPFCSNQDLEFMRDHVFNATHARDIGRVRDGKLYCTTGIGRIDPPLLRPQPDITLASTKIFLHVHLEISQNSVGLLIEKDGISIVLNPNFYSGYDSPPRFYSGYFYDTLNSRLLQGLGHSVPLSNSEVLAQKLIERNGTFYVPICSKVAEFCIVVAESRADMLAGSNAIFAGYGIGGALLGGAIAIILTLFFERQLSLLRQLRRAIQRDDLTISYQPIVDLETKAIVGAEALVRWVTQAGEHIRPDIFVALAEEHHFVNLITRAVLRKSIAELSDLLASGNFSLTINITSQDLADPQFFSLLESTMQSANLPPSSIGLELTERSTANQDVAFKAIRDLQAAGHKVYIDDFGTGYSSLAYLHQLAPDAIKIDRVFTQTVGTQAVTASVVPQILNMAHQLKMLVVVEGIETIEQADYFRLAAAGVPGPGILGQGWLFGRPVPAHQLKKQVRENQPPISTSLLT